MTYLERERQRQKKYMLEYKTRDGGMRLYYTQVKNRASRKGAVFSLTFEDFVQAIPEDRKCPVFGIDMLGPLDEGDRWSKMTIDRLVPSRGYVPGNITFISNKANTIKSDITDPEMFRRLADWLDETRFRFVDEAE